MVSGIKEKIFSVKDKEKVICLIIAIIMRKNS